MSYNGTIKAIETAYKGYKFRSRLEARWGIFLDSLGIEWEYEKEGYDLGEAGWYLPDFYLPEHHQFIEVKPSTKDKGVTVYLAGRFENDWRHALCGSSYRTSSLEEYQDKESIGTSFGRRCIGPWFLDTMGGHGEMGHESMTVFHGSAEPFEGHQGIVLNQCLSQIQKADMVFAWIDDGEAYGTIAEIGYAKALGKKVWIGMSEDMEQLYDTWFVEHMADALVYAKSAGEAYASLDGFSDEQKKMDALVKGLNGQSRSNAKWVRGLVVYGDPLDKKADLFSQGNIERAGQLFLSSDPGAWSGFTSIRSGFHLPACIDFSAAATAARSARFEHGETQTRSTS